MVLVVVMNRTEPLFDPDPSSSLKNEEQDTGVILINHKLSKSSDEGSMKVRGFWILLCRLRRQSLRM